MLRHSAQYLKLLRRSRWLLISLILVYAFVTPGAAAVAVLGAYSPSREGLLSGGLQALRLISLLATLALLLATTSRDRILAGLYFLLRPFTWIGVDIDRVAARIWLTLHYAENAEQASRAAPANGANACKRHCMAQGRKWLVSNWKSGDYPGRITRHYSALSLFSGCCWRGE